MAQNRIILYEHTVSYDFIVDTEQSRVRILSRVLILLVSVEISKTWNIRPLCLKSVKLCSSLNQCNVLQYVGEKSESL